MKPEHKQALAGVALISTGIIEALSMGAPCPVCVASIGAGAYVLRQSNRKQ